VDASLLALIQDIREGLRFLEKLVEVTSY